jgi:hypothetical protein
LEISQTQPKRSSASGSSALAIPRSIDLARLAGFVFNHLEEIGLAILLVAAFYPAAPPTISALSNVSYTNTWSLRLGPANPFELAMAVLAAAWAVRLLVVRPKSTSFDRPLIVLGLSLVALQALALSGSVGEIRYMSADLERVAMLVAGYVIVTRCIRNGVALRRFTLLLAGAIALRALQLLFSYGLTGQTGFTTILQQPALLITEDGLLLMLPVVLAWGALVDGRLTLWESIGAVVGTVLVFVINLLSLRRGAVLMIGAAVLVRSLNIGLRRLAITAAAALLIAAVAVAAGPGRPLFDQARYTVTSSLLHTQDASSSQRKAELQNFARNVHGTQWITGRGVGVLWRSEVRSPVDIAAFGGEENALTRLGWHVYGLDWAYKFGLLGLVLLLAGTVVLGRRILRSFHTADGSSRWLIYSLAVCAPPFVLLAFTNPRVALLGGILVGLLSRCCDLNPPLPADRDSVA